MKIVTTYIAYDESEFETMEECRAYEEYAWDMLMEILESVIISDDFSTVITPPDFYTLEEALDWFGNTFDHFTFIRVKTEIPSSAYAWQSNYFGYIFPQEVGFYGYDFTTNEWIKLAE